ncbi:hypothetical protein AQUCO_02300219v1 [Aquilegia coerulea]|uniref:F-box domain-containing protein n=3 Tax=Aquilegia coerulea TaxID=218851 RepID=A0A2G5DCN9_AQUCA|nr:hypothetical protein AQUCO_02300219v1 [Aquilegia coerulea]
MGDRPRSIFIDELPSHLLVQILTSGRLSATDLACLEQTCQVFRGNYALFPPIFQSLIDYVAFQLCGIHPIYVSLSSNARKDLFDRCDGNWKRVLRFLQSVEQSSDLVNTSSGNQMQISTGSYHTLVISNSSIYSCGSSLCGVLGRGPEITRSGSFERINFPSSSQVVHVSASHNHAAFLLLSGEVFTCGDNPSFCCGHGEVGRALFWPKLVETLKGVSCKQAATGLSFTAFLTRQGHVYTCGTNAHGQLGHGDNVDRPTPKIVEALKGVGHVVQIAAGPSYTLAVMDDGTVYSFGSGTNFCLGHGEQHNELQPRAIQFFKRRNIHVVRVSAGDEHVVALDSNGYVYTWGKGYCGALGHGDENDKTIPALLSSIKGHLVVQVCARKRKTFVLIENGSVYAFGWMAFGSLGFSDRGPSDKVLKPQILDNLRAHHVSQISTGLYHTVVITNKGLIFGFGDNERGQLGHDSLRACRKPIQIEMEEALDEAGLVAGIISNY